MPQKAIFLDRDGTIIKDKNFIRSPEEVELLTNAIEGLNLLKKLGYKLIIASNQSGVARGYITEGDLKKIHQKMLSLLSKEGVTIDETYYCPHLPEGVIPEYSIECECRKPKPGMILKAKEEHNIDLKASIVIGDSLRDLAMGKAVGTKTILVRKALELPKPPEADYIAKDLLDAAERLRQIGKR